MRPPIPMPLTLRPGYVPQPMPGQSQMMPQPTGPQMPGQQFDWTSIGDAFARNSNTLTSTGLAILGGGLGAAADGYARGQQLDIYQQDRENAARTRNQTVEWLRSKGANDLLAQVEMGALTPTDAFAQYNQSALEQQQQAEEARRRQQYAAFLQDPQLRDMVAAGALDFQSAYEMDRGGAQYDPDAPTSFQEYQLAQANPGYAAQLAGDQGAPRPPMNATIQREIFETDDIINASQSAISALDRALELNEQAWAGPFADQTSWAGSLFGNEGAVATQELKNIVTTNALNSLKAIFGAAPTEGERRILLEIQGSVDQAPEVRRLIFQRARDAAVRRLELGQAKAQGLRDGSYFGVTGGTPNMPGLPPEGVDPGDWEYLTPEERALFQ